MNGIKLLLIVIVLLAQSCDTTELPDNKSLLLSFEDTASTEAWLNLKTENISLPQKVRLIQNDTLRLTINLNISDTTLYIDSLLPNQTYNYQVSSIQDPISSNKLQITTMDTTSHNFNWQTFAFGEHSNSSLYDVTIIDENNIWAVGEIYINDSLGNQEIDLYNAINWDGTEWKAKRIYVDYKGQPSLASLTGTFSLPNKELIFTSGLPYLPIPNGWKLYHLWDLGILNENNGSVFNVWGSSINDLFFTGSEGTIVRYNGNNWQKIESGTKTIITDVWGIKNFNTHESEVYCAVSNFFIEPGKNDKKILKIINTNEVEEILWNTNRNVSTIWTCNGIVLYAGGDGLFVNKTDGWKEIKLSVNYYSNKVRGTALNNVFVVGGFGLVGHFNGISWKVYDELLISSGNYVSLCQTENIIVIVGSEGNKAKIVVGKQY